MTIYPVAVDQAQEAVLYTCDSCHRARRPLFVGRGDGGELLGLSCDTCLALGKFPPKSLAA